MRAAAAASPIGRLSGVFLAEEPGVSNRFGSGVKLLLSPFAVRLAELDAALTAVKPPELMAVKPPGVLAEVGAGGASSIGVSRSVSFFKLLKLDCKASDAWRVGESPLALEGVFTFDRLGGVGAGLGVSGPPYSCSSCW